MTLDPTKPLGCSNAKLRQLTRRVSQHYDHEMGKIGLKATQYSLLSQVLQRGPIRPGDLAKAMALDASTLTRNLKPLVAVGWLNVGAGTDDRSHLVAITDAGREKRTEARRRWPTGCALSDSPDHRTLRRGARSHRPTRRRRASRC